MIAYAPSLHHIGRWALLDHPERRQPGMLGDLTQLGLRSAQAGDGAPETTYCLISGTYSPSSFR